MTISYELARELRDSGFTQEGKGQLVKVHLNGGLFDEAYYPNLSELIEACGERFGEMKRGEDGTWEVVQGGDYEAYDWIIRKTPEEAVAHLWLALNKKA